MWFRYHLGLELEHDGGLDTTSDLIQTLPLGQQTQVLILRVSDADQRLTVLGLHDEGVVRKGEGGRGGRGWEASLS